MKERYHRAVVLGFYAYSAKLLLFACSCASSVLWRKRGGQWERTNVSTATQIAFGFSVNASEQVVGNLYLANGTAAFLAGDRGPAVDLNTLVPLGSGLQLYEADQVNDRGEISVQGKDANDNNHVVVLIPCDENHPGVEGCDYSMVDGNATATDSAMPTTTTVKPELSPDAIRQLMQAAGRRSKPWHRGLGVQSLPK